MPGLQEDIGPTETAANQESVRDECGRFIPGHSGNPSGRPPGSQSLTAILRRIIHSRHKPKSKTDLRECGEILIEAAIKHARKGNATFFKEILDRLDGKVPDRIQTEWGPDFEFVFGDPVDAETNLEQLAEQLAEPAPPVQEGVA